MRHDTYDEITIYFLLFLYRSSGPIFLRGNITKPRRAMLLLYHNEYQLIRWVPPTAAQQTTRHRLQPAAFQLSRRESVRAIISGYNYTALGMAGIIQAGNFTKKAHGSSL